MERKKEKIWQDYSGNLSLNRLWFNQATQPFYETHLVLCEIVYSWGKHTTNYVTGLFICVLYTKKWKYCNFVKCLFAEVRGLKAFAESDLSGV